LTFDERVVVHRVVSGTPPRSHQSLPRAAASPPFATRSGGGEGGGRGRGRGEREKRQREGEREMEMDLEREGAGAQASLQPDASPPFATRSGTFLLFVITLKPRVE